MVLGMSGHEDMGDQDAHKQMSLARFKAVNAAAHSQSWN